MAVAFCCLLQIFLSPLSFRVYVNAKARNFEAGRGNFNYVMPGSDVRDVGVQPKNK